MAQISPRLDAFLGGRLTLRQLPSGHRAGTDAVLLAACVPPNAKGLGVDVGAGVGAAGLSALARAEGQHGIGRDGSHPHRPKKRPA